MGKFHWIIYQNHPESVHAMIITHSIDFTSSLILSSIMNDLIYALAPRKRLLKYIITFIYLISPPTRNSQPAAPHTSADATKSLSQLLLLAQYNKSKMFNFNLLNYANERRLNTIRDVNFKRIRCRNSLQATLPIRSFGSSSDLMVPVNQATLIEKTYVSLECVWQRD